MINNKTRELINLAISKLELENQTQEIINDATNYLKDAILQIKKEKGPQEYKVWLFNGVLDDNYIEDSYINCKNGKIESSVYYRCSDYIEIPEGIEELHIILPICGSVGYNAGAFYDENKSYLYGVSRTDIGVKYAFNGQEDLTISLEGNEKYFIVGSESSKALCSVYYITNKVKPEKTFIHESNKIYTIDTIQSINSIDLKTGDSVITKGYYTAGDGGEAIYDIVSYEEFNYLLPKDIQLQGTLQSLTKAPVDEYGNHTLNNGLVAKLRLTGETTPEQWGAKGDGISNDCQAFTHMFAQIKTGKIVFKENATYSLGMIYEEDTVDSFKDNPYKAYMTGGLLGGQAYGKPIMANIKDVEFVGNNAKIELLNDQFGSTGMGLLNFAGRVEGLKIHDLRFDGKGSSLRSPNKNSNHTIFYAPSTFTSGSTLIKGIHPLYLEKEDGFDSGYFKNVEINNCEFFDAGAMYKKAGDYGGDFILVINPTAMDNVNIHHNRFEAWGRWVFAVDLGGNGECMTNVKFNDNVCIGANAIEWDEENYGVLSNEDGSYKYIIDRNRVSDWLKNYDNLHNTNITDDTWRWRGLGWIDFEAKKHWKNLECQRNIIVGTAGWAINGGSGVSEDVLIKDNLWYHQGGGYPYLIEHYSGYAKNWIIENNIIPSQRQAKLGLTIENVNIKNNKGMTTFRTFGMLGDITFDNNKVIGEVKNIIYKLFSLDNANVPEYLNPETELTGTLTFINNEGFISAGENIDKLPNFKLNIHDNIFNSLDIKDFHHRDLGVNEFSYCTNDANLTYFGMHLTQELNNPRKCGAYYKEGEVISTSIKAIGVPKNYFFQRFVPNEDELAVISKYNYNYSSLLNQGVNGIKYSDYKIVCTKEGIIPAMGLWGFGNQMNYFDIMFTENRTGGIGAGVYIYTKDNLYKSVSTETKTLDINNPPTHTKGVALCGDCELQWVDKIGMAKLVGITEHLV